MALQQLKSILLGDKAYSSHRGEQKLPFYFIYEELNPHRERYIVLYYVTLTLASLEPK